MRARLGDDIDDFCVKCKRIMNHAVVSLLGEEPAKVRCRTCHSDHDYRHEQAPPPKVDPRKAALFTQVLEKVTGDGAGSAGVGSAGVGTAGVGTAGAAAVLDPAGSDGAAPGSLSLDALSPDALSLDALPLNGDPMNSAAPDGASAGAALSKPKGKAKKA